MNQESIRRIAVTIAFITCMYSGFKYDSDGAFLGAVIAFICI